MKRLFVFQVAFLSLVSCQEKEVSKPEVFTERDSVTKESKFQMYEMSELALLMEQMYAHNLQLRSKILANDSLGEFPDNFELIHTAIMTDPSDNDSFYQNQAAIYLNAQRVIYENSDTAKENFNLMVESCLACHTKKCGGPIPRIKKLFIK